MFLEVYSGAESWLDRLALHLSSSFDSACARQFESLLSEGRTLIGQATALARKIVQEQATAPIIDVVTLEANGAVTETDTSFPLFPVVPREEREQFFASKKKLAQWHQDLTTFMSRHKYS